MESDPRAKPRLLVLRLEFFCVATVPRLNHKLRPRLLSFCLAHVRSPGAGAESPLRRRTVHATPNRAVDTVAPWRIPSFALDRSPFHQGWQDRLLMAFSSGQHQHHRFAAALAAKMKLRAVAATATT
jgi:hypothetical protein